MQSTSDADPQRALVAATAARAPRRAAATSASEHGPHGAWPVTQTAAGADGDLAREAADVDRRHDAAARRIDARQRSRRACSSPTPRPRRPRCRSRRGRPGSVAARCVVDGSIRSTTSSSDAVGDPHTALAHGDRASARTGSAIGREQRPVIGVEPPHPPVERVAQHPHRALADGELAELDVASRRRRDAARDTAGRPPLELAQPPAAGAESRCARADTPRPRRRPRRRRPRRPAGRWPSSRTPVRRVVARDRARQDLGPVAAT